ncbi:hypothetical protein CF327_g297 [Tilletia walkeri]|nr:hypothetical protein CF327_g297 [Tilletia walkeri]
MGGHSSRALRLNGDTSWLLNIPVFKDGHEQSFSLVLDPWLDDSCQIDMTFAFSVQSRVIKAVASSLSEVDVLIANSRDDKGKDKEGSQRIDALVLSHPFTDHAHPQTLTNPSNRADLPLLGTPDALGPVRKLPGLPFKDVHTIPLADWETSPLSKPSDLPLPPGIRIVRLQAAEKLAAIRYGPAWSKLHGALAIVWQTEASFSASSPRSGVLLYSPHGIMPASIPPWLLRAESRILIHSLHRQTLPAWLAGPVSLGFSNALELCRPGSFDPALLLGTHDEHKTAGGVVARLLKRKEWGLEEMEQLLKDRSSAKLRVLAVGEEVKLL